ncbi:MAG: DUF4364 family protein [Clostridia bacterium]|nr:DUF4364 family protein [Clostridia bacterium]
MDTAIKLNNDDDIKILILYLLENIDIPLDFDTICEVIFTIDFVRHFDFADQFADLLSRGLVNEITVNNQEKKKYIISSKGKVALDGCGDILLDLIKEKALLAAKRFLEYKEHGFMVMSYIEDSPLEDDSDGAMLHCVIKDNRLTMLNLETYVGSRRIAENMKIVFEKKAEELLNQFHAIMSQDINLL